MKDETIDAMLARTVEKSFDECIEAIKTVYSGSASTDWLVKHLDERKRFIMSTHSKSSVSPQ